MEFTKISSNKRWQSNAPQNTNRTGEYKTYASTLKDNLGIEDYIHLAYKNGSIYSSFQGFFSDSKKTLIEHDKKINDGINEVKGLNRFFNIAIIISIIATTVSVASALIALVNIHYKTIDYVKASDEKQQKEYQVRIDKDKQLDDLKNEVNALTLEVNKLKKKIK